jgi:holin-like protein
MMRLLRYRCICIYHAIVNRLSRRAAGRYHRNPMIPSLAVILLCQLAGEAFARGTGLPVPGPVVGMALMLGVLAARDALRNRLPKPLTSDGPERTGRGLLSHLSLLFVPAGVGVIQNLQVLGDNAVALAATLIVSTLAALLATVATFVWIARRWDAMGAKRP